MTIVDKLIKTAFKDMDPITGEFPAEWRCQRCDKQLNADGGHPAEIYAGTYNGLCYSCTGAGSFVKAVFVLDGALIVSWPPHCPSWRRSREEFFAYAECENCKGRGATRGYGNNTPIWNRCMPCSDRFYAHPQRSWLNSRSDWLYGAATARFDKMIDQAALASLGVKKASRKRITAAIATLPDEEVQTIRATVLASFNPLKLRLSVHRSRIWETQAPPPPTTKPHRLVWIPTVHVGIVSYDGTPEVVLEGSLEKCQEAWVVEVLARRCAHLTDPSRHEAQGLLAKEGVLNAIHIIGAGSLQLHSPESERA